MPAAQVTQFAWVTNRLVVRQYAKRTGWPLVTKWLFMSVMVQLASATL